MSRIIPAIVLALALMIGVTMAYIVSTAPAPDSSGSDQQIAADGLMATLWVQSSAEYRGAALQSYALARLMLDRALADPEWSAALEQQGAAGIAGLTPAVILDVDETVLDNSPSQARLILDNEEFAQDNWDRWVSEARATAIPGALEFTRYAASQGVAVFYVTNRRVHLEEATRQNLTDLGFPVAAEPDTVLTRDEQPGWGSDKGTRREHVAADHRILLLIGDNFGDFRSHIDGTPEQRAELVSRHRDLWGSRWILLPNPQYGSWDASVIQGQFGLPPAEKRALRAGALNPAREGDDAAAH